MLGLIAISVHLHTCMFGYTQICLYPHQCTIFTSHHLPVIYTTNRADVLVIETDFVVLDYDAVLGGGGSKMEK